MRKLFLLFLTVGVLIFSGCSSIGSRVITIGKIDVPNGKSYVRMLIGQKDYENLKKGKPFIAYSTFIITNVNGKHMPFANNHCKYEDKFYEIAYFAKAMGYKAIGFREYNNATNYYSVLDKSMISNANDFKKFLKKPENNIFIAQPVYYKIKPFNVFTIDTDDMLKVFKPYKCENIVKRGLYLRPNIKVTNYEDSYKLYSNFIKYY